MRDKGSAAFFLAVASLLLATVWFWAGASFVPAMDYPAHLALTNALHHLDDVASPISTHFELGGFPAPNSLFYIVTFGLSAVFDLPLAGRIFVALAIALFIVAFGYFAVAFGRSRWSTLAAVPLSIQWVFTEGFLDYYLGVGLLLLSLGVMHRHLHEPTRRRRRVLMVLGAFVFLAHVQAVALYGLGTVALFLASVLVAPNRREIARRGAVQIAIVWGPLLVLALLWFATRSADLTGALGSSPPKWPSLAEKVDELARHGWMVFDQGRQGGLLFLALGALALGAVVTLLSRHRSSEVASPSEADAAAPVSLIALLFVTLTFFAFYLAAPLNIGHYWNMHSRIIFPLVVVAVVTLLPAGRPHSERVQLVAALPWLIVVAFAFSLWQSSLDKWASWVDGLDEALRALPRHGKVLFVPEARGDTGFSSGVWRHIGQYQTAYNDGITTFSFGFQPGRIIQERRPEIIAEFADLGAMSNLGRFGCLDGVLHKGNTALETAHPGKFELLHRARSWSVYRVVGAACAPDLRSP